MPDSSFQFGVRFDKDEHEIDTETYIQALSSLSTLIKEANYQSDGHERISISVVAQDEGSFHVDLALKAARSLLNGASVGYLANLVTITAGLFGLRKVHDKMDTSKTVINGDEVTIKDTQGDVIYHTTKNIYNIYTTDQVVQDALSNNFKSLNDDNSISAFEIENNDDVTRIERDEFEKLAKKVEVKVEEQEQVEIPANLVIVKVVFEGEDRKWDFLYNGVKISAIVIDDNFWEQINGGKSFSKGDALVADLRIIREYDPTVAAFINKEYQVINIREHHPRGYREQLNLEDL